jgi:glyoxalase-like protein
VAGVPDLRHAPSAVDCARGEAVRVTRGELSWLVSVPSDGSLPFDGAFPTLIEWPPGPHPSSRMADLDCRPRSLSIAHPLGARLAWALAPVFSDARVTDGCRDSTSRNDRHAGRYARTKNTSVAG